MKVFFALMAVTLLAGCTIEDLRPVLDDVADIAETIFIDP